MQQGNAVNIAACSQPWFTLLLVDSQRSPASGNSQCISPATSPVCYLLRQCIPETALAATLPVSFTGCSAGIPEPLGPAFDYCEQHKLKQGGTDYDIHPSLHSLRYQSRAPWPVPGVHMLRIQVRLVVSARLLTASNRLSLTSWERV